MVIRRILQTISDKTNCLDTVPIFGHMNALIHHYLGKEDMANLAFKESTHNTGVIIFGVLGGHFGGSTGSIAGVFAGSVAGGLIGGLLVDIPIITMSRTSTPYSCAGYFETVRSRKMIAGDWLDLLQLFLKDSFTGVLALYAYNKYEIGMQSCFDFCSFMKDLELQIHLQSLDIDWLDGIPIVNDIQLLRFEYEITGSHVQTFKWAMRKVYVAGFGICGGYLAGSKSVQRTYAVSIAGGIIGGLLFDVSAKAMPSSSIDYTQYFNKMLSRNMTRLDWVELLLYTAKDGISGAKPFYAYQLLILALKSFFSKNNEFATHRIGLKENIGRDMSGNKYEVIAQKDMSAYIEMSEPTNKTGYGEEIRCDLDTCEKYDIATGNGYSFITKILKFAYTFVRESQNIPVVDISQLERGDHVVYERVFLGRYHAYDHHAIVEEVFPEKLKYRVYEQSSSSIMDNYELMGKAWIKEIERPFESISLFKREHNDTLISKEIRRKTAHYICHHATPVEFDHTYNALFNNCEHFVTVCSMGLHESQQVQELVADMLQVCILVILFLVGKQIYAIEFSIGTNIKEAAEAVIDVLRFIWEECARFYNRFFINLRRIGNM